MRWLATMVVVVLGLAGCGGGDEAPGPDPPAGLERVADENPAFIEVVCQTISDHSYQLALRAAEEEWSDELAGTGATPKEALDYFLTRCD